ncbi:hypothetical protein [Kordiimonas marina]|uniref:hypothetical protein n=1 Tax=Kordiimonas marina TaxID=2872312 RepID=UPI001FF2291C|nr:hypothetical protein [Kordiimonas marina]MCJ9428550.1 hypothetical protein [Kordiimonas marina]
MLIEPHFNIEALKPVNEALLAVGAAALDELEVGGIEAGLFLEREVKERTPVGVGGAGGLRGSITSHTGRIGVERIETVVGTPSPYAVPVELGARPHFPPIIPLVDWVIHKLGVNPDAARGVAFLVARKIATKGTKAVMMFTRSLEASQAQIETIYIRRAEQALSEIGGR